MIVLISCVSAKRPKPCAARDLYRSDWFLKARAYVESKKVPWFILSAKYGLVPPTEVIKPYDLTLNRMSASERLGWANGVIKQLEPSCHPGTEVEFLAGKRYREYLVPILREWGCRVLIPMEGLGIGQQKSWLKLALRRG